MSNDLINLILTINLLTREELDILAKRLVNDFPERADQLSFSLHVHFSDKFLGAKHLNKK